MKHIKYILLMFIFLIFPLNAYAKCSDEDKNLYNQYKDKFKVEKTFNKDTLTYNVKFYNPMPDSFKYDGNFISSDIYSCIDDNNGIITCDRGYVGNYIIRVVGITPNCNDELDKFELELSFNKYYNNPICEGIEDFVLCDPTYGKEIDYDTFVSRVNTYRRTKTEEQSKIEEEPKENKVKVFFENILEFTEDNLGLIILAVVAIIILIILIIMIIKSYKKRWKLE